ncbi:MAG: hypothetical protein ACFFCX_17420 [Candidatus Sifarchaeia archaeon]
MKKTALSVFVLSLFIGSALTVSLGMQAISSAHSIEDVRTPAVADGHDNNHLPKSILVFTQFADPSIGANGELLNTLNIMRSHFLNDYHFANLTDFNDLSSMIMDYDVFLIPEQELLYEDNITAIGAAWNGVLEPFVNNGGNLVVLDCYDFGLANPNGPSLQLLNATGFLEYNDGYGYPGSTINIIDTNNALARGIPSSFPGTDGTLRFNVTGITNVADDGVLPVVGHMTMGKGHIAIIGFDLYSYGQAQEAILVNAIQLTRHVVFDASHSPMGYISGDLLNFTLDLIDDGFAVSAMTTWNPDIIEACDVLILVVANTVYSSAEVDVIQDFVVAGGGLNVFTDWGVWGDELDPVTNRFGFTRNTTGYIYDLNDTTSSYTQYQSENIHSHSITLKVTYVEFDRGGCLLEYPANGFALVTTDDDGTSFYSDGTPANGIVVAAAASVGLGRVSVVADWDMLSQYTDPDTDGIRTYFDASNQQFVRNAVHWAAGGGVEEKFVVFDESHGRNWWLSVSYFGFGQFLTENGYTIRWIDNWTTDSSLLDIADALVIQDGSTNYTAGEISAIVNYVNGGGGLCLLGGQTTYGLEVDLVGNEFGLDLNNSGYITDTDDYLDASHQNIYYNISNFGNHPIMNGVERLELQWTSAFISIGAGKSLVRTDTDGTATWDDGTPANGLTIMTALEYNWGRVFFSADYIFPRYNYDYDLDGVPILYDSDNDILLQNVFRWLTENRAPMVEVEDPNGGEVLSGLVLVNWTAVDFDNDPMTFTVYISDNNGTDWSVLATGLHTFQYAWNTTLHDDGFSYMIRVKVVAGPHVAIDDSDAPFELDNYAGPPPGFPIDPAILAIIIGSGLVIAIVIILFLKKRSGGE